MVLAEKQTIYIVSFIEQIDHKTSNEWPMFVSISAPVAMELKKMFCSTCLERKSCTTTSKTVRRMVCRGEAELANKSFECGSEEGCGDRNEASFSRKAEEMIVGIGGHQAEAVVDGSNWVEKRMWNTGYRDNMNPFLVLATLGPFYAEETATSCELDITPCAIAFTDAG